MPLALHGEEELEGTEHRHEPHAGARTRAQQRLEVAEERVGQLGHLVPQDEAFAAAREDVVGIATHGVVHAAREQPEAHDVDAVRARLRELALETAPLGRRRARPLRRTPPEVVPALDPRHVEADGEAHGSGACVRSHEGSTATHERSPARTPREALENPADAPTNEHHERAPRTITDDTGRPHHRLLGIDR